MNKAENPIFQDEARQVLGKAPSGFFLLTLVGSAVFMSLIDIAGVIIGVIQVIQTCNEQNQQAENMGDLADSERGRTVIRRAIRQQLGAIKYNMCRGKCRELEDAIVARAGDIDQATLDKLIEASRG